MIRRSLATLVASVALVTGVALAQSGAIDPTFDPGTGTDERVFCTALQEDGKVLIGGEFTQCDGTPRGHIARLNADGSLDTDFDPGTGTEFSVYCMAVQPNGKVLIGGFFSNYDGTPRSMIARLNTDGSLDTGFDPGAGADWIVFSITVQPDGRILIGGNFTLYDDVPRNGIVRLNADGSLDTSFNPGSALGSTGGATSISSFIVLPDDRILIGGSFNSYDGTPRNGIARLNPNGSLDTSFDPGAGVIGFTGVTSMVRQPDGKVLVAGDFMTYDDAPRSYIARILADGDLDTGFAPGTGPDGSVNSIALQPDGKVMVSGYFNSYDDVIRNNIARIHADGSLDLGFDPGTGMNLLDEVVFALVQQPDGRVLVAGEFSAYDGTPRNNIARVLGDIGTRVPDLLNGQATLHAWPNPASDALTLSVPAMGWILDANGRVVMDFHRGTAVHLDGLAPGSYLLRTDTGVVLPIVKE